MSNLTSRPGAPATELLRNLYRARAFERASGGEPEAHDLVAPVAAALALRGAPRPDVLTLAGGASGAALARGLPARDLARYLAADLPAFPTDHEVPGLGHVGLMHPTYHSLGLVAPVASGGVSISVAAGIALAFALRGEGRVAVAVDRSSVTDSGGWHEGLNLAAARGAPLVVLLLDDASRRRRPPIGRRGVAYGVKAERIEEGSAEGIAHRIGKIVAAARETPGAWLVEVARGTDDAVTELEARLVQGTVSGIEPVEPETLAAWAAEAAEEAAEAWAGITKEAA
ncbi:MAG: hypothetical protein RQ745_05960 [Longimicrobiales bacterium]|nr:hypothetical protein [Longimicrobiales bacterium]